MAESTRVVIKVFINGKVRETMGATRTSNEDRTMLRLKFDKPIHAEDGEELRIEEVSNGDQ